MVLFTALFIGSVNYFRTINITMKNVIDNLAGETRLFSLQLSESYNLMESDLLVLSKTPPIQGIIRSLRNDNLDPLDGSTTDLWSKRLETIFTSMMSARPNYTQMRYIGVANDGLELVRVNRVGNNKFQRVLQQNLQPKSKEPYFQKALKLKRDEIYFSDVTYNREYGKIDDNLVETIRAIYPISDENDKLFGFLVINVNYPEMLRNSVMKIFPQKHTFIINDNSDYLEYHSGVIEKFQFHDNYTRDVPDIIKKIVSSKKYESSIVEEDKVAYFVKTKLGGSESKDKYSAVVFLVAKDELLYDYYVTRYFTLVITIILVLICAAVTLVMVRRFMNPLLKMSQDIAKSDHNSQAINLPTNLEDEIGELARSFEKMTSNLLESKKKIKSILDNVADGIITIDEKGIIDIFNPTCEKMFGYKASEIVGRNIKTLMPHKYSSKHDSYLSNYAKTGKKAVIGGRREVEALRKDGSTFPMDLSVSEVLLKDQRLFIGVIRDITQRKEMEKMKNEFVATVNHELRTPLTSIKGSLELLLTRIKEGFDEKNQKLSAGKIEYNLEITELSSRVEDVMKNNESYAKKYNVSFKLENEVGKVYVNVDKDRFDQAFLNIFSNAAKFSPENEEVIVRIAMKNKSKVAIYVEDKGHGISDSFKNRIFSKFAQSDSSSTRSKGGTGLGLNISKSIIEAFKGDITFKNNKKRKGTTFCITLPIKKNYKNKGKR